jgi:hypothetical protein
MAHLLYIEILLSMPEGGRDRSSLANERQEKWTSRIDFWYGGHCSAWTIEVKPVVAKQDGLESSIEPTFVFFWTAALPELASPLTRPNFYDLVASEQPLDVADLRPQA